MQPELLFFGPIFVVFFQPRLNNSIKILFKSPTVFKISIVLLGKWEVEYANIL
jgi:hypothetical protein